MIEYFLEEPGGDLFVANGLDPMMRWDGFAAQFEAVGMDAPLTALTIGSSGLPGPIVGTYYAYARFVDALGNVSNLSPISASYVAQGTSGTVTAATNASPIVITSVAHSLSTGTTVAIEGVGGNTSANNTWVITVVDADTFSLDESHGTDDYDGGGTWKSGIATILYTNIPAPVEAKVTRRQILRNTDGQATTFYVDIDTDDLSSTSLSSVRPDSELQVQEAVPILDSDKNPFANRNEKPLNIYPYLANHLSRMFGTGQVEYNIGHAKVTLGSAVVTGVGTDWKTTFSGRFLYIDGARKPYEILSVDAVAQTLTLIEPYAQATSNFAFYAIRPAPGFRRAVGYTESGLPQSWPIINTLTLQDTGDEITGCMQKGAFVYFLERRHVHKLTFSEDPKKDGAVFMVAERGCVNNRCWVVVDESAYMLDELGIHKFSGNSQVEHLSTQIQDLFHSDGVSYYKVQWQWKQYFHAALNRQQEVIRWFISLDGQRYPGHALCYQYRSKRWWIESLPISIGGSCSGDLLGRPQSFYGGSARKICAAWFSTLDLVDEKAGDVRGSPTSLTTFTLTDSVATWPLTGMVGTPVSIVDGAGYGQTRTIVEVSGDTLRLDLPWSVLPNTKSVYQIGGIHWRYRSGWFTQSRSEQTTPRAFYVIFEPTLEDSYANVRFFSNVSTQVEKMGQTISFSQGGGFRAIKGQTDLVLNMTRENGYVRQQIPGHQDYFVYGKNFVQFELEGFTNADQVRFYEFSYEGVTASAGTAFEQQGSQDQ